LQGILDSNVASENYRDRTVSHVVMEVGSEASNLAKYLCVRGIDLRDQEQCNLIIDYTSTIRKGALMKVDIAAELLGDAIESEKS